MKKISLILAMIMGMCSLTACGDTDSDGSSSKKKSSSSSVPGYEQNDDGDTDDEKEKETEESTEAEKETEEATEAEKETEAPEKPTEDEKPADKDKDSKFEKGTIDGNTYTSNYNNIKFTAPKSWKVLTEEEIFETTNVGIEASGGSALDTDLLKQLVIYDFVATDAKTGESIMIMYENLSVNVADPSKISIDDYMNAAKANIAATMPNADVKWDDDVEELDIAGNKMQKHVVHIDIADYNISMKQDYCLTKKDDFILVVNYTSGLSDNDIEDYLDLFTELN